jgi:preprotein translocase subunit SecA
LQCKRKARRFKDNSEIKLVLLLLTVNFQLKTIRYLVADTATWQHNKWNAAGKEITWDMIHYDVQLIGGMVLHEGKLLKCKQVKVKH